MFVELQMEQKRLGDIATYINGYAFKPKDRGTEGLPIIRIQDLTGNSYDLGFYNGEYPEKVEINNGDILISWSASLGVYIWNRGKALLNQHIFKVVFDKLDIDKQYFVFAARYNLKEMEKQTHGATMKHITKKDFDNILIPFPDLRIQSETAETLDKLQSIITHIRTQLEKLDLLVKARFVEMFENIENMCTIADACSIITDGTHQPPKFTTDGIPFLFVSNIATNEIVYNAEKFISEETYNDLYKRTPIEIGDIILSTVGSYGHPAIVKTNKKFLFQRHIAYLKPIPTTINSIYLHRAILSDNVQRQIDERVKGIAQKTLNLSEIRKIVIPAPPLELQTQFADFVKQVDQSKSILQQELTQTQTLFDSLMQEYFG